MSELSIQLHWERAEQELQTGKYSNAHRVKFNDRYDLTIDADPIEAVIRPTSTPNRRWRRRCPIAR